jgi:hypothetical protein
LLWLHGREVIDPRACVLNCHLSFPPITAG